MTTTPAPKGAGIEPWRAGFEAWARTDRYKFVALNRLPNGEYRHPGVQADWIVWAAGSSTSTSQGAAGAAEKCRSSKKAQVMQEQNDGAGHTPELAETRMGSGFGPSAGINFGAASVDALDARRYRWARDEGCNFVWAEIGAGNFRSGLDEAIDARMASSAIAASTSK